MGGQRGAGSSGFHEVVFGGGESRECARGRRRERFVGERMGSTGGMVRALICLGEVGGLEGLG